MTTNEIKTITAQIADAMSMPINPTNPAQLNLKINKLTLMLAASCHTVASAERLLSYKELVTQQTAEYRALSAAQQKRKLQIETRPETFFVTLTGKQYYALLAALEGLTTVARTLMVHG